MAVNRVPLVVVLGTTGAGKSKLAIEIAKFFSGEIISADSMQIYKGLDIITNKVTEEEQRECPHHMISYLEAEHKHYNIVDFRDAAVSIIDDLLKRRILPVLVGGTNYYIESVLWNFLVDKKDSVAVLDDSSRNTSSAGCSSSGEHIERAMNPQAPAMKKPWPPPAEWPHRPTQSSTITPDANLPSKFCDLQNLNTPELAPNSQAAETASTTSNVSACSTLTQPTVDNLSNWKNFNRPSTSLGNDCETNSALQPSAGTTSNVQKSASLDTVPATRLSSSLKEMIQLSASSEQSLYRHGETTESGAILSHCKSAQVSFPVSQSFCDNVLVCDISVPEVSSPASGSASVHGVKPSTLSSGHAECGNIASTRDSSDFYQNRVGTNPESVAVNFRTRGICHGELDGSGLNSSGIPSEVSQSGVTSEPSGDYDIRGLSPDPDQFRDDPDGLIKCLHDMSNEDLFARLQLVDPTTASRQHPNNRRKVVRALQVYYQTGRTVSSIYEEQHEGRADVKSGPLRYSNPCILWVKCQQQDLDQRLDDRVDDMMRRGLVHELENFHREAQRLESLRAQDSQENTGHVYPHGILQMIGFKEFHDYLQLTPAERLTDDGQKLFNKGVSDLKLATRRYARQQAKWIKNRFCGRPGPDVPPVYAVDSTDLNQWDKAVEEAIEVVRAFTKGETPEKQPEPPVRKVDSSVERNVCDACGGRIFIHKHEWAEHLKSKKHKYNVKMAKEGTRLSELLAERQQQLEQSDLMEEIPAGEERTLCGGEIDKSGEDT